MKRRRDEPTPAAIARVERILRDDIVWAMREGPGWNPDRGAMRNGEWKDDPRNCGVCAIGAFCVRRQPPMVSFDQVISWEDVAAAAKQLKVSQSWLGVVYQAVAYTAHYFAEESAMYLGRRLADFAESEARDIAGQLDQLEAEARGLV